MTKPFAWLKIGLALVFAVSATVTHAWAEPALIQNRWVPAYLHAGNGLQLLTDQAASARWEIERLQSEPYVRLRSLQTGQYLHIENGPLQEGNAEPGWWSAMWTLESVDGPYFRLQNRWKPDQYILTDEAGRISAGPIEPGWWSAMWTLHPIQNAQPAAPQANSSGTLPNGNSPQAATTIEQATGQPAVELFVQNFSNAPLEVFIDVPSDDPVYVQTVGPGQQLRQQSPAGAIWSLAQNDQWVGDYQLSSQGRQVIRYPDNR
jgi:hypothetical protein